MGAKDKVDRDSQLDVIRGLAILSVVAVHSAQTSKSALDAFGHQFSVTESFLIEFAYLGQYGVELFFLLSGVLLAKIYGRQRDFSLGNYTQRRLARILPLWYVFAIASFLLFLIDRGWWKGLLEETQGGVTGQLAVVMSTLFFLTWAIIPGTQDRALAGGWSIESEMAHYSLFPLIRDTSSKGLIFAIALCGFLASINDSIDERTPILVEISSRLESLSIFTTLPFFLFGMLIANWGSVAPENFLSWRNLPFLVFSTTGLFLLLLNDLPYGIVREAAIFVFLAYGVSFVMLKSTWISSKLSTLGKYSFFIYFFHFYVVSGLVYFQPQIVESSFFLHLVELPITFLFLHFLYFSIALVLSHYLGSLSYRYFEKPFITRFR